MSDTRRYQVSYEVTSYFDIYVERPVDISKDELLNSITRNEVATAERSGDGDDVRDAVRSKNVSLILDDEGEEIEFSNWTPPYPY